MTWWGNSRRNFLFPPTPLFGPKTPQPHDTAPSTANMVLAKSKKSVGLGNSLMNDRFSKGKGDNLRKGNFNAGIERTGQNGEKVRRIRNEYARSICAMVGTLRIVLSGIR